MGLDWFKLLNCVALSSASDSDALFFGGATLDPVCVQKGTNEDSAKAVTGK